MAALTDDVGEKFITTQSQIKGGSSIFVKIILHQEFSLYLLNLEVLGRPEAKGDPHD